MLLWHSSPEIAAFKAIAGKMTTTLLASIILMMVVNYGSYAQNAPFYRGRARLFVADNSATNPAIIVIDLPGYNISQRIQLPGTALQLGVSADNAHVGVFRNRDNNQQFFSVINTGIVPVLPAAGNRTATSAPLKAGELGFMRPAFLAKNVILVNGSDAIGGVEGGLGLVYHEAWGLHLMYAENHGRVFAYRADDLNAVAAFKLNMTVQVPVGHFHAVPYGNFMLVPHANANKAYILDRTSKVVREYACAACDGTATFFEKGNATVVFGCGSSILVVRNTSATAVQVPVTNPRIDGFVDGVPGVFWSSTTSQRFFWRTDVRATVPRVTNVTHRGSLIRMASLPTKGRFVALHRDGFLVLYDGESGAALAEAQIRAGGFPANQTAPYLQTDVLYEHVFVAVPALGVIHSVHVDHGGHDHHDHQPGEEMGDEPEPPSMTLERSITVGGSPTSMTLAYMPGVAGLD